MKKTFRCTLEHCTRMLSVFLILLAVFVPGDVFSQTLKMHLPFSGDANDASGSGNNGTVSNATLTTDRYGNANSAYYFNGSNAHISVPDAPSLRPTSLTLSCWVKMDNTSGLQVFAGKTPLNSWANPYVLYLWNSNLVATISNIQMTQAVDLSTGNYPSPGTWFQVVETFDDATNQLKIYVNGVLQNTLSTSLSIGYDAGTFEVGADVENGGYTYWYAGSLDEVRLYEGAMSAAEVQALYDSEAPPPTSDDADGDGFTSAQGDCNDNDNSIFPAAPELCDFKDNDCDGLYNEGLTLTKATIATGTITNATCINGTNGSVSTTITKGTPPYAWQWQKVGSEILSIGTVANPSFTGLAVGDYWLIADDAAATGCPRARKFIVKGATATITSTATCGKANGKLTLKVIKLTGQTFTVQWPNGSTGLSLTAAPGSYTATITLSGTGGCTYPITGVIESTPAVTIPTVTIAGASPNASATVITGGGTAPFTFSGKRNSPTVLNLPAQTSPTFSPLSSGIYTFNVSDSKGCIASRNNVNIPVNLLPPSSDDRQTYLERSSGVALQIFPNPTENWLHLSTDLQGEKTVSIFNSTGKLMLQQANFSGEADFQTENFQLGVYQILIENERGERLVERFLKI